MASSEVTAIATTTASVKGSVAVTPWSRVTSKRAAKRGLGGRRGQASRNR